MGRAILNKRKGFTLIEMLIVIVVIGILAMIIIPRLAGAARKGREAALRADLKGLRDAIEQFEGNTAAYPPDLRDILAADGVAISGDTDGRGMSVDRTAYTGPYMQTGDGQLPKDPITGEANWVYDNTAGQVRSASDLAGLNGIDYSSW